MSGVACPHCGTHGALLVDVVTGAELLGALVERSDGAGIDFEPDGSAGECLVYLVRCEACGEQSMESIERLVLTEDPEPIG
jgi:hypothetical protein